MLRGTKRPVPQKTLKLRANIHNRFDIEVIDAATGEIRQRARAFNVICNTWWDKMFNLSGSSMTWWPQERMAAIAFGTGSGTPSASDTALFSYLGSKNFPNPGNAGERVYTYDLAAGIAYRQGYIVLQAEEYVGSTITEVGLSSSGANITTHAMLEDMNGNPISIQKTATDVIKIYGTVYLHFPSGGWYNGSIMVAPPDNGFLNALLGNTSFSNVTPKFLMKGAAQRNGVLQTVNKEATITVDQSTKKISFTGRWAAGEMNLPIRAIRVDFGHYNNGSYISTPAFWLVPGSWYTPGAISAEPVGTGDGVTTGFSTAFPVGAVGTVKVDGVAASGATMRLGPADLVSLQLWMNAVYKTDSGKPGYENTSYGTVNITNIPNSFNVGTLSAGQKTSILENPFSSVSIEKFRIARSSNSVTSTIAIRASDDMENWTDAGEFTPERYDRGVTDCAIPAALQNKRYWQLENTGASAINQFYFAVVGAAADQTHNIVFSTPPAAGAVITADYTPDCVAKDSNHVFDLSFEMTLGDYEEA